MQFWELSTGSKIAYTHLVAEGVKKKHPIIYLHGGPGGFIKSENLKSLSALAESGFEVYLYDQIGSGRSARLDDIKEYTTTRHRKDLEAIVEEIGAPKVILIGQSWGACLATAYIAENHKMVEKLVFTGPGPILPFDFKMMKVKAPDSLHLKKPNFSNQEANKKARSMRSLATSRWAKWFLTKLATDEEVDGFQTFLNSELRKSTVVDTANLDDLESGDGYYSQLMTAYSFQFTKNPRSKIKNLEVPLLLMRGQYDNQPWGYTKEYLEFFTNAKLEIIEEAGHSIDTEQTSRYQSLISNFLNDIP